VGGATILHAVEKQRTTRKEARIYPLTCRDTLIHVLATRKMNVVSNGLKRQINGQETTRPTNYEQRYQELSTSRRLNVIGEITAKFRQKRLVNDNDNDTITIILLINASDVRVGDGELPLKTETDVTVRYGGVLSTSPSDRPAATVHGSWNVVSLSLSTAAR